MAVDRIGTKIESLLGKGEWKLAQTVIEKALAQESDDHWLWSRLSTAKYEQRDYQGALETAKKALEIVDDCPLALWSYAGALDMLGKTRDALRVYSRLIIRGLEELNKPAEDAEGCWEGVDWTRGLVMDCIFRLADCLAEKGMRDEAVKWYDLFLNLLEFNAQRGIYTRKDAVKRLRKIVPRKEAVLDTMKKQLKKVMG